MSAARNGYALLLLPMLALLTLVFLGPLLWFLIVTLGQLIDQRGLADGLAYAGKVLASRAVVQSFVTTLRISVIVTFGCLVIAYPLAYFLSRASKLAFNLVVLCVIVPYFTSVIVRTYAWMVLLGSKGLINDALVSSGLVTEPLDLLYNERGILIGMIYVLLPYMVLTLYAAMKSIDPRLMQAARGMGAGGFTTFWKIYFPLSLPGVVSGGLIVFILAVGYFITPALMGGPGDIMIAMKIQHEVEIMLNWPLAAVMALALLVVTLLLFFIYIAFGGLNSLIGSEPE
ncbi:ABC-type spermidine/putrescine transport system permease subunit I [Rhodopseudomonas julia]|uniref:ABC-type spermidine/putrescine transport system permease subunit I n=1 Tax=Rhodopseudomonas julia TaxID=200617 RepID=A0ABU0CAQ1_9BRAD|nr:ABC transporter permease [Rhodopseudomonas julia]MDQ0327611.1 ABC-type spermidine/putrescine transport system permease subunit I [Rhodopseudomonas julia]